MISRGNALADEGAKAAAKAPLASTLQMTQLTPTVTIEELAKAQTRALPAERQLWKSAGATYRMGLWYGPNGRPCLPKCLFPIYANMTHGRDHVSKGGMVDSIDQHWYTQGFSNYAQSFCAKCIVCVTNNIGRGKKVAPTSHPQPSLPFDHLMMDFIELTPCEGKKYCLVIVDMFSKWVEVFPTKAADSAAVAKALITEIIPRWGIPKKLSSDNGSHFVNQAIQQLSKYVGIDLRNHCAYHPQSGGAVERENGTLKNKLAKAAADTGMSWLKVLPLVLLAMRGRTRVKVGLSPYEVLMGRPMPMGTGAPHNSNLNTEFFHHDMIDYCVNLSRTLQSIRIQVKEALPLSKEEQLHDLQPGDWIVVKDYRRRTWNSPRWLGPFQVLLITSSAVKVAERATWIHASHCRRAPPLTPTVISDPTGS